MHLQVKKALKVDLFTTTDIFLVPIITPYSQVPYNRGGWNSRRGGLETLVYINRGGAGIVGGLETLVCTNNRGVEYG